MEARADERHLNGSPIVLSLGYVRSRLGEQAMIDVARDAGEDRPLDALLDHRVWSTYGQVRRVLESTARSLGGVERLRDIGRSLLRLATSPAHLALLQELGSPDQFYEHIDQVVAGGAHVLSMRGVRAGADEWLAAQWFHKGFEPFPEYCAYASGLLEAIPTLFGLPTAEVVEEQCQCRGASSCRFRVRLRSVADDRRRADFFETRVELLEGQLRTIRDSIGDLVSGGEIDEMLERIMAAAASTIIATRFVLVLAGQAAFAARVAARGIDPDAAQGIADRLPLGERAWDASWIVTPVTSRTYAYGWLVVVREGGAIGDFEIEGLETYAKLAAAALDVSMAVEAARRETAIAETLLELSTSLAGIMSVEEMAARLARTVPVIVGADRAAVALFDQRGGDARLVGTYGYPPEIDAWLRSLPVRVPASPSDNVRILGLTDVSEDTAAVMRRTGSMAAVWVPIVVDGEWAGAVMASVTHRPERMRGWDIEDRLRGLASQAATTIRNARLLDQVSHQAFHDALTGLPNRTLILDRVQQMLARSRRNGEPVAAMFIDLDGFKDVNDSFGHAAGDQLLRAVAERLAGALRDSDTIGRVGGDEFVVLVEGSSLDAGPELIAQRVIDYLREPFVLDGHSATPLHVTASIGVAIGQRDDPGELVRDADIALYRAKAAGKDCYVVFEPEMQSAIQDRLLLQMDLLKALERDELFLLYQPVFDLRTGEITGVETLLRWRHPERGVVQPSTFVPLLEESGAITDVGGWVMRTACCQAARWVARGRRLSVAVNVSARQLQSDRLLDDIDAVLASSGMDPSSLILEVTETTIMRDTQATVGRLHAVKRRGVRIAIDDFGTGYSSLAYLQQFPVDTLKIDKSFVTAIGDSPEAGALIHTLVQLGKTLGLETVAEGIEEPAQLTCLQAERCDTGQGFLFAPPLTSDEIERYLDEHPSGLECPNGTMGQGRRGSARRGPVRRPPASRRSR